jgi:hypothetical protein
VSERLKDRIRPRRFPQRSTAALALCIALCAPRVAAAEAAGFALIVTNNRSQSTSRPDLHYADDDGVQYAELFGELIGEERVTLLTQLDAETTALHPQVQARAPTRANLLLAVARLAEQLRHAHTAGIRSIVYIVFAGHGDLDRGQGYLDLADARLTARELDERVIQALPADRIHLVLDSCNSYFLLNPRKSGGKRWRSDEKAPRDLLAKYPHLGALLSTSAEAVTYEWSELQSGVFSYEVRAGLRGAADVNRDGRITYAELTGFIQVANQSLVNDLYRPKVFARAPSAEANPRDALLAQLPAANDRKLLLGAEGNQRLTLRDPQGVRLMDVNKEAGTPLTLSLPPRVAVEVQQHIPGPERPAYVYRDIPEGEHQLSELPERAPARSARGEAALFEQLFAEPFGKRAFARVQAQASAPDEPPSGVTQRDVERLRLQLSSAASAAEERRITTGLSWLAYVAVPMGALTYAIYRDQNRSDALETSLWTGLYISLVGLNIGIAALSVSSDEERLDRAFRREDYSTERARSRALPKHELRLQEKAQVSAQWRKIAGFTTLAAGGVNSALGGVFVTEDIAREDALRLKGPLLLLIGLGQIAYALYQIVWARSPLENTWEAYSRDPAVLQRRGD